MAANGGDVDQQTAEIIEALVIMGRKAFAKCNKRLDHVLHVSCDTADEALGALLLDGVPDADT